MSRTRSPGTAGAWVAATLTPDGMASATTSPAPAVTSSPGVTSTSPTVTGSGPTHVSPARSSTVDLPKPCASLKARIAATVTGPTTPSTGPA